MCQRCEAMPDELQELFAALYVTGCEYRDLTDQGKHEDANQALAGILTELINGLTPAGLQAVMGILVLMAHDQLRGFYVKYRMHHARQN